MFISIEDIKMGGDRAETAARCLVYLDGRRMYHVVAADDEVGYVEIFSTDEMDDPIIDWTHPDTPFMRERRYGEVKIIDPLPSPRLEMKHVDA